MTFLKKILLVDYEAQANALVRRALEQTGQYLIKEEHDGRRALHAARWFRPDLILFDFALAERQAAAVARDLQADPSLRDTPVVFVSLNSAGEAGVSSGGILGGYSFMAHPVRLEEVMHYVAELLGLGGD